MGAEIFHTLKAALKKAGHNTNVGDEGGFAPNLPNAKAALDFVTRSIEQAGYRPGREVFLALDCAATELYKDGHYIYRARVSHGSSADQVAYLQSLVESYPIASIEDGMAEDDWDGFKALTDAVGARCQLVGDDLFVTNTVRLKRGIELGVANSYPRESQPDRHAHRNLDAVEMAQNAGYTAILSHRSGETEDTTIADLAVATNCGQIKTGSLARADRTAKYNQLLRIEEHLGRQARYAGTSILK